MIRSQHENRKSLKTAIGKIATTKGGRKMSRQSAITVSAEDKIRLNNDARDAARLGLTVPEFCRLLDSASYGLYRAFPANRADFRFKCHRYHVIAAHGIMSIYRTGYDARPDQLICERRQEN
jgi:hypothetical protein